MILKTKVKSLDKYIFILLAVVSFFPNFIFVLLILMILVFTNYKSATFKYIIFILFMIMWSLSSMLIQTEFYYKGLLLSIFLFLPFFIIFFKKTTLLKLNYKVFMKTHIYLSLLQIPIQLIQLINNYGFSMILFSGDSSMGDSASGTIVNSFVLADKQLISIFFLLVLKKEFKKKLFLLSFISISFSFLLIGANTTLLVLLLAILIYHLITFQFIKYIKRYIFIIPTIIIILVSIGSIFHTQYTHIMILSNHAIETSDKLARLQSINNVISLTKDNPEYLIFGLGVGHYSSRVSYILSGEYLWQGEHPLLGIEIGKYFNKYMYQLWNDDIRFNTYLNGTLFQPFSEIITILSEYGIFVFIIFSILLIKLYFRIKDNVIKVFLIFCIGMLFLDNFFEYPRILLPVLILLTYTQQRKKITYAKK